MGQQRWRDFSMGAGTIDEGRMGSLLKHTKVLSCMVLGGEYENMSFMGIAWAGGDCFEFVSFAVMRALLFVFFGLI